MGKTDLWKLDLLFPGPLDLCSCLLCLPWLLCLAVYLYPGCLFVLKHNGPPSKYLICSPRGTSMLILAHFYNFSYRFFYFLCRFLSISTLLLPVHPLIVIVPLLLSLWDRLHSVAGIFLRRPDTVFRLTHKDRSAHGFAEPVPWKSHAPGYRPIHPATSDRYTFGSFSLI